MSNIDITMLIIWAIVAVFAAIFEAATVSVVSCWFVVGAIFAAGASLLGANVPLQIVVFVIVSAVSLVILRPLLTKRRKAEARTNADALIGKQAIVTDEINNLLETGAVKINGLEWTARSNDGTIIPTGSVVTIEKIEGVKLIVK